MIKPNDTVKLNATLLVGGVPTDPTTLTFTLIDPLGSTTVYTYGVSAELTRLSAGIFRFTFAPVASGEWKYSWNADGSVEAVSSGFVSVAHSVTMVVQSDNEQAPVFVQFVRVNVYDADGIEVGAGVSNENGQCAFYLSGGPYTVRAAKQGWRFGETNVDVDTTSTTFTLAARRQTLAWLTVQDLETTAGADTVDQLFYNPATGGRDTGKLQRVMQLAEAHAESRLMRAWSREDIKRLAIEDESVRGNAAWLALEFASESRPEFLAGDGKGRFWAQYERAMQFFDAMSKNGLETRASQATKGAPALTGQAGGMRRPRATPGTAFVFADEDGKMHGGF